MLVARLQLWRTAAMGAHAAASLWDSGNAFPSSRWEAIDAPTLPLAAPADAQLLWFRWHRMVTVLASGDGQAMALRPNCGDRQGEGGAPQRYILASDPEIERWAAETHDECDEHSTTC